MWLADDDEMSETLIESLKKKLLVRMILHVYVHIGF